MHARARRRAATHPSEVTVRHEFHGLMSSYWMWMGHGPRGCMRVRRPKPNALPKHAFLPPCPPPHLLLLILLGFPHSRTELLLLGSVILDRKRNMQV